eukprot:TRINITY_DN8947_c0_g1_i1.p1 TRINITY_DN8947_c0_g1~~TRINITY_DN8947_c0_g1_i1.p1  ORF type:complete len:352 (+),score=90.57 TRINITY_DN8947_c0_g1_i1:95-1150(+)
MIRRPPRSTLSSSSAASDVYKRQLREISILTELRKSKHPNIVAMTHVMGVPKARADLYIAFEYFDGDMRSGIRSAHFRSYAATMKVAVQVLSGLSYIHACGLIHLDLKPENLLIKNPTPDNESFRIAIADFGLARPATTDEDEGEGEDEDAEHSNSGGTWGYMAPELLLGIEKPSFSSDVWAVGVILGELYAGAPFIKGRSKWHLLRQVFELTGVPSANYIGNLESNFMPTWINLEPVIEDLEERDPEPGDLSYWKSTFKNAEPEGIQFLKSILAIDPVARPTVDQMLQHHALHPYLKAAETGLRVNESHPSKIEVPLAGVGRANLDIVQVRKAIFEMIEKSDGGCKCTLL